ncbi:MAG: peptidylprolyl isomerase [Fimbriimonadaceae bacterium]|nr:peptidylprolyl isomerase [Chitinophagales bacterium]
MKKNIFFIACICISFLTTAQPQIADKIIAQVDENIILKSDVESVYQQDLQQNKGNLPADYRCSVLQQFIAQKLLLVQAAKDSIIVGDDQVEYELDRRIRYFESMFGSREKMEDFYGKTVQEMKEEFRDDIKKQLLAQQMQSTLFGDVTISPSEVKEFFNKIPKDSLPYYNAEVEVAQIVLVPEPTADQKAYAKEKIEDIRKRIMDGEDFDKLGDIYTNDRDEADNARIDLGCVTRGSYVPEFEAAAFKLKQGEISEVVQTQFGYHLIKLVSRQGDNICLKHILIVPPVTNTNMQIVTKKLDSIRTEILAKKITFYNAATKFSMDSYTNLTGGDMQNPQSAETYFEINELEPEVYYAIEKLAPGEITQIMPYTTYDGKKALRIILLKTQTKPHIASLDTDYNRMQQAALTEKKFRLMDEWLQEKVKTVYLKIDPAYSGCENIDQLINAANNTSKSYK